MALKDLLPPGTFDEISSEAYKGKDCSESQSLDSNHELFVSCPYCKKRIVYSSSNPFRPFCSERCKMLDLGAWANEEHCVPGNNINVDDDSELLNDPNLPVRNIPHNE